MIDGRQPNYRLWMSVAGLGLLGLVAGLYRHEWWLSVVGGLLLTGVVVIALAASRQDP